MKTGPIADWEMEKARNSARARWSSSMGSSLQRAVLLVAVRDVLDEPDLINTRADEHRQGHGG